MKRLFCDKCGVEETRRIGSPVLEAVRAGKQWLDLCGPCRRALAALVQEWIK